MAVFTLLWWSDPESAIPWEYDCTKEIISLSRKFYDPQQIFQPGDLGKGLRTPREFDFGGQWDLITELAHFGGQWDLITELAQDWGNRFSQGTIKTLCASGPSRKEQWPHKRLSQTCLWASRSLQRRHRSAVLCCRVRALSAAAWTGTFEGGFHYLHYLHHSLVSGQTIGREHSPAYQQKIGLKIYWAWPCPSEQDPVSHSVSLSHQEASISPLSFSIRGQIGWKPQSQKTNQTDHMDHSLV